MSTVQSQHIQRVSFPAGATTRRKIWVVNVVANTWYSYVIVDRFCSFMLDGPSSFSTFIPLRWLAERYY